MNLFDLFFVAVFFASLITLCTAGVVALRGRRRRALRILGIWALFAGAYLGVVFVVSAATPERVLGMNEPQCNGEWCITVQDAAKSGSGSIVRYDVTLRLFTTARRVAMGEKGVAVYLTDSLGRRFDPLVRAGDVPLDTRIQPGESLMVHRVFQIPPDGREVGLVVAYESGLIGCFPGCFVITENGWFHKPPIVRLD